MNQIFILFLINKENHLLHNIKNQHKTRSDKIVFLMKMNLNFHQITKGLIYLWL